MLTFNTAIATKSPSCGSQDMMSETTTSKVDDGKKVEAAVKWVRQEEVVDETAHQQLGWSQQKGSEESSIEDSWASESLV